MANHATQIEGEYEPSNENPWVQDQFTKNGVTRPSEWFGFTAVWALSVAYGNSNVSLRGPVHHCGRDSSAFSAIGCHVKHVSTNSTRKSPFSLFLDSGFTTRASCRGRTNLSSATRTLDQSAHRLLPLPNVRRAARQSSGRCVGAHRSSVVGHSAIVPACHREWRHVNARREFV